MPLRNLPIKTGHLFLGLAGIMFIITVSIFSGGKHEAPAKVVATVQTQMVVVPLTPISEGKTISMNDITTVKWPKEFLPRHSTFKDASDVVGRVAKQDLFPGEPIFIEKVSGSDTNGGLPAVIPPGLRAVSVAVTEVKGVAGFVKPGDRVDVLSTFEVDEPGAGEKLRTTRTVLQNVLVLAAAQTMVEENKYNIETPSGVARGETSASAAAESDKTKDREAEKTADKEAEMREKDKKDSEKTAHLVSTVTLALTPAQTETLSLAEESGELRLALRPETDHSVNKVPGVDFDQLIGRNRMPAPQDPGKMPPPPPLPSGPSKPATFGAQVEFIQGTTKSTLQL